MIKVAINGFGRIGRMAFRKLFNQEGVEIVAINDLSSPDILAYLLKYDSIQGPFQYSVYSDNQFLVVDQKKIQVFAKNDPSALPWQALGVDIVLECTGVFATKEKASQHLAAGARKVIISAPAGKDIKTVVFNVNHEILSREDQLISAASCTTNCLAPMAKVLHDNFGIISGQMTTIHAYTNSQPLMDTADRKGVFRKSRAAADSIIPFTTGAAKAIGLVIPALSGRLDGASQRVPVHAGSLVELYTVLEKETSEAIINEAMRGAANDSFGYNEDQIVSQDILGSTFGSLFDATQTKVVGSGQRQLVKTTAWYDNEMSFVAQLIRLIKYWGAL